MLKTMTRVQNPQPRVLFYIYLQTYCANWGETRRGGKTELTSLFCQTIKLARRLTYYKAKANTTGIGLNSRGEFYCLDAEQLENKRGIDTPPFRDNDVATGG